VRNWKDLLPRGDEFDILAVHVEDKATAEAMKVAVATFIDACPDNPEPGTMGALLKNRVISGHRKFLKDVLGDFINP